MPSIIAPVVAERTDSITFAYQGDQLVTGLGDVDIPVSGVDHYTDSRSKYEPFIAELSGWLSSHELRVQYDDEAETALQPFEDVSAACELVNAEYAATVTRRLQKMTGNPDHRVPELDPRLVYASYVSLRAGGAVVLPTSVGNIVGAASPRGLSTMFAVKERPPEKAGVVLTTMDQVPDLAEIPEGWEGYLRHMHAEGILTGAKLPRNNEHPLFLQQPEWSRDNSTAKDGTSMFVTLPGPYSDVTARVLAKDGILLTASSANKSGQGNTRDLERLHPDIKRGCDFVAWDPQAVDAYILDEEHESQGVMVDFLPDENGDGKFHIIRLGFMNGPFITQSRAYIDAHPELNIKDDMGHFDLHNRSGERNR